jgi:7-cyano-7-deazaguanine synthase
MSKLVLSFSGGADSSVLLYMAGNAGYTDIYTLSFDYGQRHCKELECVQLQLSNIKKVYKDINIHNKVIDTKYIKDIASNSSLTNLNIDNPNINEMAGDAQPISYVPFRNMMFLSIACAYAETQNANTVWYGAAQADSLAGYWDGSEEYITSINSLVSLNRKSKINIEAPLISMSKKEIITTGHNLGVRFGDTWTCYSNRPDGLADAKTPSSSLRLKGFIDAGFRDPIKYVQQDKLEELYSKSNCVLVP